MKEEWWERPTCFLCDRWWLLLAFLAIGLTAYFTRGLWLPTTEISAIASLAASSETALPELPTLSQFTAPQGQYSLEYPSNWQTETIDGQTQQWILPEDAVFSIHSEPVLPGEMLESFAEEVVSRMSYNVLEQTLVEIGGEPAIRQTITLPGSNQIIAMGYLVIHSGQKYQIGLAGLSDMTANQRAQVIQQFEQVVSNFLFQQ